MVTFLKRTLGAMVLIIIGIVAVNAILWIGQEDYKEAYHRQDRMENYDIMLKNANEGNHHLNREFLDGGSYDN